MADKKEQMKIQKVRNELNELSKTIEKNKLEFADKVYKKLNVDYLNNDEMKNLINKLADDTMSIYEIKYNKLIGNYEKLLRKSESLCLAVMDYVQADGQVDFKKAKTLSNDADPFFQEIQEAKKQLKKQL